MKKTSEMGQKLLFGNEQRAKITRLGNERSKLERRIS